VESSQIYYPDINQLSGALNEMYTNYDVWAERGKRQGHYSRTNFSMSVMKEKLGVILEESIPHFSVPVPIVLPKLKQKKIDLEAIAE
jgi:hypothetical protein